MIYLIVIFLLLILSFRYDINGKTKGRDQWYLVMLVIFILVAGLRWRIGTDTIAYLNYFYHEYPTIEDFSFEKYSVIKSNFYVLMNSIVISLGGKFFIVQLLHATFINGLIFKYIKRHSPYLFTCLFFYAIIKFLSYNTEIMRGSMSIAICLFANDYFLDKKWIKGYLLLLLAFMFHAQTIVLFLMPFLLFLRFNRKGIVILGGALLLGYYLGVLLNDYIEILLYDDQLADKALNYANSKYGQESTWKAVVIGIGIQLFYLLITLWYLKKKDSTNRLLKLEPLVMFFCVFLLMNAGFKIVYRYVEYYSIYAIFLYSYGFVHYATSKTFKRSFSYARSFILFFPLIWLFCRGLLLGKDDSYKKYFPYSSIIEMSVDNDREKLYNSTGRASVNYNEY